MPDLVWIILAASLCLVLAALLLADKGLRQTHGSRRLDEVLARHEGANASGTLPAVTAWVPPWFERYLHRAGLPATPLVYAALLAPAPLLFLLSRFLLGPGYALLLTGTAYPLLLSSFIQWRIRVLRRQIVEQLPNFLESIVRILSVGCSLELAFRNASEECDGPLYAINQQVLLRTRAGQSLEDALIQLADVYAIREMGFVASLFHLGIRYGGNAHAVLERLSQTLRERRRGQQELKAMTAETRASAWILSALPIVVGLLTLTANPAYLTGMWTDPGGRQLLLWALGLQIAGMLLLFRMARID